MLILSGGIFIDYLKLLILIVSRLLVILIPHISWELLHGLVLAHLLLVHHLTVHFIPNSIRRGN